MQLQNLLVQTGSSKTTFFNLIVQLCIVNACCVSAFSGIIKISGSNAFRSSTATAEFTTFIILGPVKLLLRRLDTTVGDSITIKLRPIPAIFETIKSDWKR